MRPHQAYKNQQNAPLPRIELILALYRKALELLPRARQAIAEERTADAQKHVAQVQLIVTSLGSGHTAGDEASVNFLRLYEFVSHRLTTGASADLQAAEQVLRTLFEAFAAVRDQAADLESQGQIPPLEREHLVELTA